MSRATGDAEAVERRVAEMLREDARAESVEILEGGQTESGKEGSSEDLDVLAAEIENDMPSRKGASIVDMGALDLPKESERGKARETGADRMEKQPAQEKHRMGVSRQVESTDTSHEDANKHKAGDLSQGLSVDDDPAVSREGSAAVPHSAESLSKHPALVDIENKIKEKQELLSKALNPILKKRFSQAIADLQDEYEAKRKELSN